MKLVPEKQGEEGPRGAGEGGLLFVLLLYTFLYLEGLGP